MSGAFLKPAERLPHPPLAPPKDLPDACPRPAKMSLAGCTGANSISLMKKMKKQHTLRTHKPNQMRADCGFGIDEQEGEEESVEEEQEASNCGGIDTKRLSELADLRDRGVLSPVEFEDEKQKLINRPTKKALLSPSTAPVCPPPASAKGNGLRSTPSWSEPLSSRSSGTSLGKGDLRILELRQFDMLKCSRIDLHEQTFKCDFFLQLAFPQGAKDPGLSKADKDDAGKFVFPLRADGAPTWSPSAGWFMEQFDMVNAIEWVVIESEVLTTGLDLCIKYRVEGTFRQQFALQDFPFDAQKLSIDMCFNCRTTGHTPIQLVLGKDMELGIVEDR